MSFSKKTRTIGEIITLGIKAGAIAGTLICSLGLLTGNLKWFVSSMESPSLPLLSASSSSLSLLSPCLENMSYDELKMLYEKEINTLIMIKDKEEKEKEKELSLSFAKR